jgi:RNA polymerase sigma-70 factor (sigma-E family)
VFQHEEQFTAYARSARSWLAREALRLCGDPHEAEDLAQETLVKILGRWGTLTRHDDLLGYARQTLRRVFLSERRRARWRYELSHADPPEYGENQTLNENPELAAAITRLGPRQRAVVILRFWQDLSVEQTAALLGCSTGTVTSQTVRALRTLRKYMEPSTDRTL